MPRIEATVEVPVSMEDAFALSQSQREVRFAWDPFVVEQYLIGGAVRPDRGVRTFTRSKHRLSMVSEYTSFRAPTQVGMKMVEGPPFFSAFGGGWSFREVGPNRTSVTWRYTFSVRPKWLSFVGDRIGNWLLQRDIEQRLGAFARGCSQPELVSQARQQLGLDDESAR